AGSVSRYKKGNPSEGLVIVGGKIVGAPTAEPTSVAVTAEQHALVEIATQEQQAREQEFEDQARRVQEELRSTGHPKFPRWVMEGTSLYENLAKPVCAVNSRYPEFMWMPAVVMMLNYIGQRVRIKMKNSKTAFYMVSVGKAGRVIKSSSASDAFEYFSKMGLAATGNKSINNANGKMIQFSSASFEGLGKEMNRLHCSHALVFYDEFKKLTDKAGIDNSSLITDMLTAYEGEFLGNTVKNPKDSFVLSAGSYTVSLIACTTRRDFGSQWGRLVGSTSGLEDRFFFLLEPPVLDDITPYIHVDTSENSIRTRILIEKAMAQGEYEFESHDLLQAFSKKYPGENRLEHRAEKLALYFAVDMGLDLISDDCIERATAVCEYERAVK